MVRPLRVERSAGESLLGGALGKQMGFLFFDDSNHEARGGFALGAFVYVASDPVSVIHEALRRNGLKPGIHEFKSSAYMSRDPVQASLRAELRRVFNASCRLGVAVAPRASNLGQEGLRLLRKMLAHPDLAAGNHEAYFDEGLFPSTHRARRDASTVGGLSRCRLHFEQNSSHVAGIQLADLAAHTCAVMLLESLGLVTKTVKAGDNSGYDPDLDIEIGFELRTEVRYHFLSEPPPHPDLWDASELQPVADVRPYGLHVSANVSEQVRAAAVDRFGSMYLGCIH